MICKIIFYLYAMNINLDFQRVDLRPLNWFSELVAVARDTPIVINRNIEMKMEATIVGEEMIKSQNSVWTISGNDAPNTMLVFVEAILIVYINIFDSSDFNGLSLPSVDKNCLPYKIVFPLRIIFSCVKWHCNTDHDLRALYYKILAIIKIPVDATLRIIRAHLINAFAFFDERPVRSWQVTKTTN